MFGCCPWHLSVPPVLAFLASSFPLKGFPDELPKPVWKLAPKPPENGKQDSEPKQGVLYFRTEQGGNEQKERKTSEKQSTKDPNQPSQCLPPEGHLWLGSGEIPAAALGTYLGDPGIRMSARTESYVIAPSAEIAEERFSGSHASAFVAIFHRFESALTNGCRASSFGRSQTEENRPS